MQLLRLLGPSMYKGDVLQVAVKELLQNSFDAVKKFDDAQIDIKTSSYPENCIICKDNGVGMSSETVKNVYLTIGGTLKEMDVTERSGGLGLAKVQFFLSANRIVVDTVRNGEHTLLDCTQEELLTGTAKLFAEPTSAPNGTTIKLFYPKEVHQFDGSITVINMPWSFNILDYPLLGYPNVKVTHNDYEKCKLDSSYTHHIPMEFAWGYVDIYYNPDSYSASNYGRETEVYSAGLYQFRKQFRKDIIGDLKFNVKLNIRPKVAAGMAGYPFNNTREGFNVSVQEDVKTISKYLFDIQSVLNSERVRNQFASLTSLDYISVDGTSFEKKQIAPGSNKRNFSPEFLSKLHEAFMSCSSIYEKKSIVEEAETMIAASKEDTETFYGDSLKLNNRTTGSYSCFDLFSKVSSAVLDIIQKVPVDKEDTRPTISGIIIEKSLYGCLTTGTVNGIWINPLNSGPAPTCELWVYDMMNTLIHELAHINCDWHGDRHNSEMIRIAHWLISEDLYTKLDGKFRAIYAAHEEDLIEASRTFANSRGI